MAMTQSARLPAVVVRRIPAPSIAVAALLIHAGDAWVIQVEGRTGAARRAVLLAAAVAAVVVGRFLGRSLGDRARAVALLSIGLASLVVVAPILGSYVDKLGVGGSRFTGFAAVAGGVVLTAVGATRLVRMATTRWRKLLAFPIALVIAQFFVLPVGSAVLITNAARPPLAGRTPAGLGLDYRDVTIRAYDGTSLSAWYVAPRNGAVVVLRHGSGSTRVNVLDHAGFLARAGYGVLLMDARGHGTSGGRINELGWHGPEDIAAAVDFLESEPGLFAGIGVLGLSMGGEEGLHAAAADDRIAAVVAEGVGVGNYDDSVALGAHVLARAINRTQYAFVELLSDAPQPDGIEETIGRIAPRPVLLIAGDVALEKELGRAFASAGGPTTELWELADAPHTDGLRVNGAEYRERVLDLFDRALLN